MHETCRIVHGGLCLLDTSPLVQNSTTQAVAQ
jgi:hypothetical protein